MIVQVQEQQIYTTIHGTITPIIRTATEADVEAIAAIVNEHARLGQLLPRSVEQVRAGLPNWLLAEVSGAIVGIGSLLEMGPRLVEIRSLAVVPTYRGSGVGGLLVRGLVEEARQYGVQTVFALTRAVPFFERLGFQVTGKERFPEKVWRDCVICPLRERCDETAVVLEI